MEWWGQIKKSILVIEEGNSSLAEPLVVVLVCNRSADSVNIPRAWNGTNQSRGSNHRHPTHTSTPINDVRPRRSAVMLSCRKGAWER